MEAVLITGAGVVGKGILSSAISDLYRNIKDLTGNSTELKLIEKLDLKSDIEIIEALLKDIQEHKRDKCHVVQMCISQIHDLITKINKEIETVGMKIIDQHYAKYYFYNWVAPHYQEHLEKMQQYKILLNNKVDMLIKILSMK